MKPGFYATFLSLALFASPIAAQEEGDMVVVNGRYVVAKDSIRAYFYRQNDQRMVFDVRWSDWSTQYRCQDSYDRGRIEAAALNLVLTLEKVRALDFGEFLESEGFEGCAKF